MAKNVIVVGMARSGTSAVAAPFARHGHHLGEMSEEHIRAGDANNPFGYFEADDLIARNVEVLQAAGYRHHNTWRYEPIDAATVARIATLTPTPEHARFVASYERHTPWLWKDPRLCFTLSYWWKLVDPDTTHVVLVRRDPEDVYRSFRRVGWCGPGEPARRALIARVDDHVSAARRAVDELEIPATSVDYADLKRASPSLAAELSRQTGLRLAAADFNARPELDHSSARGRVATTIGLAARQLPSGVRERIERLVPRRLLTSLFRERRYTQR